MRWNRLFIPTLRENPAEVEVVSNQLLLRAGYARRASGGSYSYLPLAQRSLLKIQQIVREEMNAIGAQEFLLAAPVPARASQESERSHSTVEISSFAVMHEEAIASIARGELRSYRQLPQIWYQIHRSVRDERRTKSGLSRLRPLLTTDSYSFDLNANGLDTSYRKHREAYCKIFERCGLEYIVAGADAGAGSGNATESFMVTSDAGEDVVVRCTACGYAATLDSAVSRASAPLAPDPEGDLAPEAFPTPGLATIAEVSQFTNLPQTSQMKSLVMVADETPVLTMLRGDHQLNETKLATALHAIAIRPATPQEIFDLFGANPGSLGPVGVKGTRILADSALRGRRNMIGGANRDGYHLRNVTPEEDFAPDYYDLRQVTDRDTCAQCGGRLELRNAVEVGHLSRFGTNRAEPMGLRVLDESGNEAAPVTGSYGIDIERILTCAVELHHDKDGMALPPGIAPFVVVITPVNVTDAAQWDAALQLYHGCQAVGIEALLDDRDERAGVKFKDADLIGVPYRITVGRKIANGTIEFLERRSRKSEDLPVDAVVQELARRLV